MKSRGQAVLVSVFAAGTLLFAWVSAAVVALVTLRKGPAQGLHVLLWALLPALLFAWLGDIGPLAMMVEAVAAAAVLRATASWSWTLATMVAVAVLLGILLLVFGADYLAKVLALVESFFAGIEKAPEGVALVPITATQFAGMTALSSAFVATLCLMLARWWQALLYNPGGFRTEFHQLRLQRPLVVVLLAAGIGVSSMGAEYSFWALLMVLPLVFAGFSLVHALVAQRQIGNNWLVLFYMGWLLLGPIKVLLLLAAVADSWLDIRTRWGSTPT